MKRRTFLLLEVLIALFLVTLCIIPLVREPLRMLKKEMAKIEEMEKERLADYVYSQLREKFLKNEIPWSQIPKKKEIKGPLSLPSLTLKMAGFKPKKIPCSYSLYGKGEKQGRQQEEYRLIYVTIYLDKAAYKYRLPLQKKSLDQKKTGQ